MIELTDWAVYSMRVIGTMPCGKRIRTSTIVSRDGDVVRTASGSVYKLMNISKETPMTREELYDLIDKENSDGT